VIVYTHFDIIYDICEHNCISPENLKWKWIIPLKSILIHDALTSVAHASSTSWLDYCKGCNGFKTSHLVTACREYYYITTIMKELHWLPVIKRISFKTIVITYALLNGQEPINFDIWSSGELGQVVVIRIAKKTPYCSHLIHPYIYIL